MITKIIAKRRQKFSPGDLTIHNQFSQYGRNAKEWLRKCALLLPEIDRRQIWKKKGFSSLFEYAAKIAGMSRSSVDEALRVLRHVEDKPELRKVIEQKGIQSVRPVVAVATQETAGFWADKAMEMSKHTLEAYVNEYKKSGFLDPADVINRLQILPGEDFLPENGETNKGEIFHEGIAVQLQQIEIVMTDLTPEIAAELKKLKGAGDWNSLMKELLELRRQKIESEKPAPVRVSKGNDDTISKRKIPADIKRYVISKTRGQCAFPVCTKQYEILHHTQRWKLDPVHDPDHIVALCKNHERLAHHGLIENEKRLAHEWKILKEPIWTESSYLVDQTVMEYRQKNREI